MFNINFIFAGARRVGAAGEYGTGHINTPIHLGNLQCTGDEGEIYQCMGDEQPSSCTHDNDVSVECLRKCILSIGIFELICDVIQSKKAYNCDFSDTLCNMG